MAPARGGARRGAGAATLLCALAVAGCGSGLVGDGVPSPTRSVVFGHRTAGSLVEGWLAITQQRTRCNELGAAIDGGHDTGDALLVLAERDAALGWEGLYPGTVADAEGGSRHAEVYLRQAGDLAALTGNDVWVRLIEVADGGRVHAEIDVGELAAGFVVTQDCGAF